MTQLSSKDWKALSNLLAEESSSDDDLPNPGISKFGPGDIQMPKKPSKSRIKGNEKGGEQSVNRLPTDPDDIWDTNDVDVIATADDVVSDPRDRPQVDIIYKQRVGSEDLFLQMNQRTPLTSSCEIMVVTITMKGETKASVDCNVTEVDLDIRSPLYRLHLPFPHSVKTDTAAADYTTEECIDMIFMYGYANGNASAAAREYARRFPARRPPHRETFSRVFTRARNGEMFQMITHRASDTHDEVRDEVILDAIAEVPTSSTRRLGLQLGVPHSSVHAVLRRHSLHPYHLTKVQELLARDAPLRLQFCHWYRAEFPYRGDNVLWTDEATFTRSGSINLRNSHVWDEENPHATVVAHHQYDFRANVWAGMTRNQIFGPLVLPHRVNSAEFRRLLDNEIFDYLEDMPLEQRRGLWFQMDGCPAHRGRTVTEWMNSNFENRMV